MDERACVYKITNTATNDIYVGATTNFYHRKATHESFLKKNMHPNPRLQEAFNKYGADAFLVEILEIVDDVSVLNDREQYYCDLLKPAYCIRINVRNNSGIKMSAESGEKKSKALKGRIITEEHRRKIGAANSGTNSANYGKPAYNRGVPMSDKQKEKISRSKSTISEDVVLQIRKGFSSGIRQCDLARQFEVSSSIVYNIVRGISHKHLLAEVEG